MSAHYGQSPYAAGGGSSGGYNSSNNAESPLNQIREYTSKVEDLIDQYTQPIKPHLPALGRFLIVVTFLEDALRIVTQWSDQKYYLQKHRGFPWGISHIFLLTNVVVSCLILFPSVHSKKLIALHSVFLFLFFSFLLR
jgi:hypothetical protein